MARREQGQLGFAEAFMTPGLGVNAKLERIDGLVKWYRIDKLLEGVRRGEVGRPPYLARAMFKALLLQQWYGLSDPGLEEALSDRLSFRRFCGFVLDEPTPDETTIWRFRQAVIEAGAADKLLAEIDRQLDKLGFVLKRGTMIDASLVAAQARPPAPSAGLGAKSTVDPDADWTRQHGGSHFGYKAHIAVDHGSGLIRTAVLTSAKVYESEVADGLIMGDERAVYGDRAYEHGGRRTRLKAAGIKDRIMHRRHKHQARLPHWQRRRNALIAPIRAGVERLFAVMKRGYGWRRVRYFSLQRNALQLQLTCIAINLRRLVVLAT